MDLDLDLGAVGRRYIYRRGALKGEGSQKTRV